MDVPLYAIALVVFGGLYLGLGVFLVYVLIFSLIAMYLYLAVRYEHLPEGYPHGAADTLVTVAFIGVTWGIFTLLAPKNPIPFVGDGLTYTSATVVPIGSVIAITLVLLLGFVVVGAFILPKVRDRGAGSQPSVGSG